MHLICLIPRLGCLFVLLILGSVSGPASAVDEPVGEWPLSPAPEVVHGFDPPGDPWGSGHRGVDLAGTVGQPVRSALPGVVSFVGKIAGKPVVTVAHGATRTTYEPVVSDVEVGTQVVAGERIGSLQLPFSHCFPSACLHWGWLQGETYLDPLGLVREGRVRLLPLWREDPVEQPDTGQIDTGHSDSSWRPLWQVIGPPFPSNPVVSPTPRPAVSGAWMGLSIGLPEPVSRDVGVELGRGQ